MHDGASAWQASRGRKIDSHRLLGDRLRGELLWACCFYLARGRAVYSLWAACPISSFDICASELDIANALDLNHGIGHHCSRLHCASSGIVDVGSFGLSSIGRWRPPAFSPCTSLA